MTSPELAERGRTFRQELFTDEFLEVAGEHLRYAPDAVIGQYSLTNQYHVTHATNIENIQERGLQPGLALFDPEDQAFFEDQYRLQKSRAHDYGHDRIVSKYIFGNEEHGQPRGVYATSDKSNYHVRTFAIPERTKFFLRNMQHLSKLPEANTNTRQHAELLVQKYSGRLVLDGEIEAAVFRVDPRSPQLMGAIMRPYDYEAFGEEFGLSVIRQDQAQTMLELRGVSPSHMELQARQSFDAQTYLQEVLASDGQVVFRSPDYSRMVNPPRHPS
jgi:hypothetical protein